MARGRGSPGGTRQRKHWVGTNGLSFGTVAANGTSIVNSIAFTDPATILRLIGEVVTVFPNQTLVANDAAQLTLGIGLVSSDAAAVGFTALPDPLDEPGYDWLWWYSTFLFNMNITTENVVPDGSFYSRIPIQSKAMRKLKPNMTLVLVQQYLSESGSPTVGTAGQFRCLIGE